MPILSADYKKLSKLCKSCFAVGRGCKFVFFMGYIYVKKYNKKSMNKVNLQTLKELQNCTLGMILMRSLLCLDGFM